MIRYLLRLVDKTAEQHSILNPNNGFCVLKRLAAPGFFSEQSICSLEGMSMAVFFFKSS
jgi:hypothetical protein